VDGFNKVKTWMKVKRKEVKKIRFHDYDRGQGFDVDRFDKIKDWVQVKRKEMKNDSEESSESDDDDSYHYGSSIGDDDQRNVYYDNDETMKAVASIIKSVDQTKQLEICFDQ